MQQVSDKPKKEKKEKIKKDRLPPGVSKRLEVLFGIIEDSGQKFGSKEEEEAAQKKGIDAKQEIRSLMIQAYAWLSQYEDKEAWPEDERLAKKIIEAIGEEQVQLRALVGAVDPVSGSYMVKVEGNKPFWKVPDSDTTTNLIEVGRLPFFNLAGVRCNLMLNRLMRLSKKPI